MGTYRAVISQVGSSAPVANVKVNDTGMTVAWIRESAGQYSATFSEDINAASVELVYNGSYCDDPTNYFDIITAIVPPDNSNRVVVFTSQFNIDGGWDNGQAKDDLLKNWSIEVRL